MPALRAMASEAGATETVRVRLLERSPVIDELLGCGLLVGDGPWLRFRHEIARLAVEDAIAAHRRRAIHAKVLDAMRARRR